MWRQTLEKDNFWCVTFEFSFLFSLLFTFLCQYSNAGDLCRCSKGFSTLQKQNLLILIAQKSTKFELVRSFNMHNKPFTVSTPSHHITSMRRTKFIVCGCSVIFSLFWFYFVLFWNVCALRVLVSFHKNISYMHKI